MKTWAVAVAAGLVAVAGCSFPPQLEVAETAPSGRVIVAERTEWLAEAQAAKEPSMKHVAPGAVALISALVGANPLGVMIAYGATAVGVAAVEQGKGGIAERARVEVPVTEGQCSRTEVRPDGSISIEVWPAVAPRPPADDEERGGLSSVLDGPPVQPRGIAPR